MSDEPEINSSDTAEFPEWKAREYTAEELEASRERQSEELRDLFRRICKDPSISSIFDRVQIPNAVAAAAKIVAGKYNHSDLTQAFFAPQVKDVARQLLKISEELVEERASKPAPEASH